MPDFNARRHIILHEMIQGETSPRLIDLKPELIIRSST